MFQELLLKKVDEQVSTVPSKVIKTLENTNFQQCYSEKILPNKQKIHPSTNT